jgi:hypothetical protein
MQDYREIDRIRKNPVAVSSLAKRLLVIPNHDWNDWELEFLEHIARHRGPDPITTRQGEKLIELRDDSEYSFIGERLQCRVFDHKLLARARRFE